MQEARDRYRRCVEFQGSADKHFLEDEKFANADAYNHWQWPDEVWEPRNDDGRPCLTINKTRVHNNIVINESLKNKSSIKVRPTGGIATYESSQAMQSMIRRIEYVSKADSVYEKAIRDQVDGGIGYVLLETRYVNDRTFDQDIFLKRCKNPLCVFLDPDIMEADGSDARFGFIFDPMPKDKFDKEHRKFKNKVGRSTLENDSAWLSEDHVLVARYYRREGSKDTFISYVTEEGGERVEKLASEIEEEAGKELLDLLKTQIENGEIDGRMREVINQSVQWFDIAGDVIMDRGDWAGSYIPISRCVGVETFIEGQYDRKGHTRALIDPQCMLNYNASGSIEFGALQSKSPYIGPARAFEGQEQWKDANKKNYAFLAYNDIDEEAPAEVQTIEAPQRQTPPQTAPVYMQGMMDAERQMMMVSGQYQAQMGENDTQSAASGKAINERQRQGDTATYHFVEHQADMIRYIGMQLLDLIPKIYDTERLLHVLGEDGTKRLIKIVPDQQEAIQEIKQEGDEAAIIHLNPKIGEYDCVSDVGPNYATQRQEAWNAIALILQQNQELTAVIGDILFQNGDFPGSEEIRERLKKEIKATKPYLFADEAEPQLLAAQQQMHRLTGLNIELTQKLAMKEIALKGKDEKRDIDASRAQTDHIKVITDALAKLHLTPADRARMEHEIALHTHDATLDIITQANASEVSNVSADSSSGDASQAQSAPSPAFNTPRPIGKPIKATPELMDQLGPAALHPNGKRYAKHKSLGIHFEVGQEAS